MKGKRKQPLTHFVIVSLFGVVGLFHFFVFLVIFMSVCFLATSMVYPGHKHVCSSVCMWVHKFASNQNFLQLIVSLFFNDEAEYKVTEKSSAVSVLCYYSLLCNAYACVMNKSIVNNYL